MGAGLGLLRVLDKAVCCPPSRCLVTLLRAHLSVVTSSCCCVWQGSFIHSVILTFQVL